MGAHRVRTFICKLLRFAAPYSHRITTYKSCLFLLCGRLADVYGRKLVFLIGVSWVGVFALGCGFSRNASELLVLRGLQGIGSAAAGTSSVRVLPRNFSDEFTSALRNAAWLHFQMGILAQSFPPGVTRRIAFSVFAAAAHVGGAIGLILGSVLAQMTT